MSDENHQLGAIGAKMDLALEMLRETRLWQQQHAGQGPDTEHAQHTKEHATVDLRLNSHARQLNILKGAWVAVTGAVGVATAWWKGH